MKIHNIEQGSEAWFLLRQLRGTASEATAIRARGKGLQTYAKQLVREYLSSAQKEHFTNEHTERGNELEPQARSLYELTTGNEVVQVGFIEYNDYIGCSPDGLIGEDGDLEIKCPGDKVYFDYILGDAEPVKDYYNQIQMRLLIEERKWCDLFVYNPNFTRSYILTRVLPDEVAFTELKEGFEILEKEIKRLLEIYNKK